jgi:hypothetical protein
MLKYAWANSIANKDVENKGDCDDKGFWNYWNPSNFIVRKLFINELHVVPAHY